MCMCIFVFFCVSLDHFGFVLSKSVLLGFVFSIPGQVIGWEERLQNDLSRVEWNVKPQSVSQGRLRHINDGANAP